VCQIYKTVIEIKNVIKNLLMSTLVKSWLETLNIFFHLVVASLRFPLTLVQAYKPAQGREHQSTKTTNERDSGQRRLATTK
jgi:hypothetical protein